MPRRDYELLKDGFEALVKSFRNRDLAVSEALCDPDLRCFLSVRPSHFSPLGLRELQCFIRTFPETDSLHLSIYNYVCRLNAFEAQSYGQIVAIAANEQPGTDVLAHFHFVMMLCCHWRNTPAGWRIDELKLDVHPMTGTLQPYFAQTWHLADPIADLGRDDSIPCIQGEFDSPWLRIPDSDDVLTEAEKVKDCVAKRFFGMDHFVVEHTVDAYSRRLDVNSLRYAEGQGIRALVGGLRFKRQKDRYWCHPWRIDAVTFDADRASALTYRVAGFRQRNREYVWTRENRDIEHVCQICRMDFVKEDGVWRIVYNDITLGLYELNRYDDAHLFGDRA